MQHRSSSAQVSGSLHSMASVLATMCEGSSMVTLLWTCWPAEQGSRLTLLQPFEAPATQAQRAPTSPFMQKQLLDPGSPFPGQHSSDFRGPPSRLGQSQSWSGMPTAV